MKHVCGVLVLLSLVGCGKEKVKEVKGTDGVSCYTESMSDGTKVICGDTESFIPDGQNGIDGTDGVDGQDGSDGISPDLDYVTVCPDIPGQYPEVLLRLDGQYMAFLTDNKWKEQRLVILEDGTYKTSDGRDVTFIISGSELICPQS